MPHASTPNHQMDCSFRIPLLRLIRAVVASIASNPALEVPIDAMTAVVRSLSGLINSVQVDLAISDASRTANATNATSTSNTTDALDVADGDVGSDKTVNTAATTIDGEVCPTDLLGEAEESAIILGDAISKAALEVINQSVAGEAPLEVPPTLSIVPCSQPVLSLASLRPSHEIVSF